MKIIHSAILSQVRLGCLISIIIVPAVLALPNPISWTPFHYREMPLGISLEAGTPSKKAQFPIPTGAAALGESLFSSVLGIQTKSMPTYICANNNSQVIYYNNQNIDSQTFFSDGGTADISISLDQDGEDSTITVPLASSTCEMITSNIKSGIGNQITWSVQSTNRLQNIIFKLSARIGFQFKWLTYFQNYLILLAGLIVFLASLIQVLQSLRRNDKIDLHNMDNIDKKILEYLTEKDKASEASVINETNGGFSLSKEDYVHRLKRLQTRDLIRYERPFGNGAFVYITERGRGALVPVWKRFLAYISVHAIEILTLLVAGLTLWVTLK